MPSENSSVHDRCGRCPHERRHHGAGRCILCPGFAEDVGVGDHHAFVPAAPPGSASSSPDDPHCQCGHFRLEHQAGHGACAKCAPRCLYFKLQDPADAETAEGTVKRIASGDYPGAWKAGPAGTLCRCGHARFLHGEKGCSPCEIEDRGNSACRGFADPVPAGKAEWSCIREGGCRHLLTRDCEFGCRGAADEVTRLGQEIESECAHLAWECYGLSRKCADCGQRLPDLGPEAPECGWNPVQATTDCDFDRNCPVHGAPPRRPPYAVAYAVAGGHEYEIALPGDASVIAEDGVLKISHPSAVLALTQVQPFATEQ